MSKKTKYTIAKVGSELSGYMELKRALEGRDDLDAETIADTLEGASDLPEMLLAAYEEVLQYNSHIAALKGLLDDLTARKGRLTNSMEMLRACILQAMDKAGIDTITGAAVTLSRRATPGGLIVTEEADIPADYWKQNPVLDKKKLLEDLRAGTKVKGATLGNGGVSLTARVK